MPGNAKDHQSRKQTEQRQYEQLRESGVTKEAARSIARESSEAVHRNADRTHSDR